MADEIIIETTSQEVIEVGVPGPQGPAGAAGTGLETLTTQGDTLYRGAATGQRLPIGTTGQILRVSASGLPEWGAAPASGVISVNDQTGEVFLDSTDIFTENALQISDAGIADCNGVFVYGGLFNGRPTYYATKDTFVYWDGSNWVINHNGDDQYFGTATTHAWQAVWSLGDGTNPLPVVAQAASHEFEQVVGQRTNPTARGDAASKNVGTGANDVAAGNHTHSSATQSVAGFLSTTDKTKLDGIASGATANTASTATPSALGTAAAGTSSNFARADHVHALPTAADVGAAASNHTHILATDIATALAEDPDLCRDSLNLGDMATEPSGNFSTAGHTHGNITNDGKVGSDSGRVLVTTTAGAVTTLALGTAGQVLRTKSDLSGVEFADPAASGVTGAASSASDVLGVSGANITGVDAGSDKIVFWDDSASELTYLATVGPTFDGTTLRWPVELVIACSDESTNLTTGTAKVTFRAPYAFTLTAVRASVNTAPTGSTLIVDINEGGTSVISTKLSIDASEKTSTTAASAAVISDSAIADDAEITIDIDQIGSTIAGKGLKVVLIGTRA